MFECVQHPWIWVLALPPTVVPLGARLCIEESFDFLSMRAEISPLWGLPVQALAVLYLLDIVSDSGQVLYRYLPGSTASICHVGSFAAPSHGHRGVGRNTYCVKAVAPMEVFLQRDHVNQATYFSDYMSHPVWCVTWTLYGKVNLCLDCGFGTVKADASVTLFPDSCLHPGILNDLDWTPTGMARAVKFSKR